MKRLVDENSEQLEQPEQLEHANNENSWMLTAGNNLGAKTIRKEMRRTRTEREPNEKKKAPRRPEAFRANSKQSSAELSRTESGAAVFKGSTDAAASGAMVVLRARSAI